MILRVNRGKLPVSPRRGGDRVARDFLRLQLLSRKTRGFGSGSCLWLWQVVTIGNIEKEMERGGATVHCRLPSSPRGESTREVTRYKSSAIDVLFVTSPEDIPLHRMSLLRARRRKN